MKGVSVSNSLPDMVYIQCPYCERFMSIYLVAGPKSLYNCGNLQCNKQMYVKEINYTSIEVTKHETTELHETGTKET